MISRKKVLLAPSSFAAYDQMPIEKLKGKGYEIIKNPFGRKLSKSELIDLLPGVSGIIAGLETFDREVFENSNLKVISRCGSGISNIDLDEARCRKIKVRSTPYGPVESVAELTVGMAICLMRHVFSMNNALHSGRWEKCTGFELRGKTVAIIGLGRIGLRVAELLRPFDVKLIAVDPYLSGVVSQIPITSATCAFQSADVITLHSSGENLLLGETEFQSMKPGTFLLNSARGGLVDEAACVNALRSKIVAGAWFDCFREEPYGGALLSFANVILTPHIGSYSFECRRVMELEAVDNLITEMES